MIHIQLTSDEVMFLLDELAKERWHVENELVHTDDRSMQAGLTRELTRLDELREKVSHAVELYAADAFG